MGNEGNRDSELAELKAEVARLSAQRPKAWHNALSPRGRMVLAAGCVVALALTVGAYVLSPYGALNALQSAAKAGDEERLQQLVDFPQVRENLKSSLSVYLLASFRSDPKMANNPFAGLGLVLVPALVDKAIDAYVTPDGIAVMVDHGRLPSMRTDPSSASQNDEGASALKSTVGYSDLNHFEVDLTRQDAPETKFKLVFERRGLVGWKLIRIGFTLPTRSSADDVASVAAPASADDSSASVSSASSAADYPFAPAPPQPFRAPPAVDSTAMENPPSSTQSQAASARAAAYLAAWSSPFDPNGEAIRPYYAQNVNFYGSNLTADQIMVQKAAFAARWPSRRYSLRAGTTASRCSDEHTCFVSGVIDWNASNPQAARNSSGASTFAMTLQDGEIISESSKVIARH